MNQIHFLVNGENKSVGADVDSNVTLLDYIRNYLELRGTKYMCREGGCGACIVSVVKSPGEAPVAVNSCLVSVTSCYNWEITTVEKVGNRKDGYHPIQTTLAEENGTQCGHCTPGWIMSMYSLLQSKKNVKKLEIEKSFGSNICRCTGYRAILQAFKKFAQDESDAIELPDIEDLQVCKKTCINDCKENDWCFVTANDSSSIIKINLKDGKTWFRVSTVYDIFDLLRAIGDSSYMLVAGNTAKGAFPINSYPDTLIDVSGVSELKGYTVDQNLKVGAGTTLSEFLDIIKVVKEEDNFGYLNAFYDHIHLVAHIPVRNLGSIAGNLMLKHQHNDFPSDIFLLLLTVGADLTIQNYDNTKQTVAMDDFLKLDMKGNIILNVSLPPFSDKHKIVTYKIMPRSQNAHAIVNVGFLYKYNQSDNVVERSRIVYSGLAPPYTRALKTEKFLAGRQLFSNETLQGAIKVLNDEIVAVENLPEPPAEYRKQLALGLFYKGLLFLCPKDKLKSQYRSGASKIHDSRLVSKGQQTYDTKSALWPLTQPLEKVEALRQCSGEVIYTEDMPSFPNEVFAAFVLSTESSGKIQAIDPSVALSQADVVAFYDAKDIPGINSFTPNDYPGYPAYEEVLCSGEIKYYNQPIGVIVAKTRHLAERAAGMVQVTYTNTKSVKPVVDIKEAKEDPSRVTQFIALPALSKGFDVKKVIKGENTMYQQYHFTMETLACVTRPSEDGTEIYCSTQWSDGVQIVTARALKLDANSLDVYVRRIGGGFGIKVSRTNQIAVACTLVSKKLNLPCRFIPPLTTVMRAIGKKLPSTGTYEVGVDNSGAIQYMNLEIYEDNGFMINEILYLFTVSNYPNVYNTSRWSFKGKNVVTDTHKNTWLRAPGALESIATAEFIMERISYETSVDPIQVRLANLDVLKNNDVKQMLDTLISHCNYKERRNSVDKFNIENRWKKRGIRVSWMKFGSVPVALRLEVNLSVFHVDGTVVITHSGVEMGQGINTKAVQIAAHFLNIPVDKIKIKGNNSIIAPNATLSGASITTQCVGIGVQRCCVELLKRLAPVKLKKPFAPWEEIIATAYSLDTDLQVHEYTKFSDGLLDVYKLYGVAIAEVEVDILTGESEILRADLLQDAGQSVNPDLDIGQVEGAFIMGVGYWTSEKVVFNPENGQILTDRTWNYHVPQARDIPQEFNVGLRKNSYSSDLILGAKATSEPPMCLSVVVPFAIREAITSARLDSGIPTTEWFALDGPYTLDKICMLAATKKEDFKFY